jgi:AcrR family transcriptional regulator
MAGETRRKILEATEHLAQIKGLGRVTTKEIAQQTGLSEGALYRHFVHKEEVFFAILAQHLPPYLATLQTYTAGSGALSANLEGIALATMRYYRQLLPISAALFADTDLLDKYRALLHQIEGGPHVVFELVAAYIREEQQRGRITPDVPALTLAILLLGPCFQYEFVRQFTGDPPFQQTDETFVQMLVRGLAPGYFPAATPGTGPETA